MKNILIICMIGVLIFAVGVFYKENKRANTLDKNKNLIFVTGSEKDLKNKRKRLLQTNGIKKLPFDLNSVETSLVRSDSTNGVVFTYEVRNKGEQDIKLVYSSSQAYEYEVYSKTGDYFYRYSDGKLFTQAIREKLLPAGESISVTVTLHALASGEYTLIIWITARGMNYFKEKQTFKVN